MSKIVQFLLQKIGIKLDAHKLKKFIDLGFIVVEKILVKFHKLYPLYFDFYGEMTENEINLANISEDDIILHIGGGPIPATSILLAKKSGARVTSIDNNLRSVKQAISCVLESGIADKVQIQYADANSYPVDNFDVIIVSQGIRPYKELLQYISKSMRDDARVIFRTSTSPSGEIVQKDLFLKEMFKIGKIVAQKKNALLISILLLKK
jgi:D-arabinose 1-dehydrogenase-like Zn-dependent alcohol dehydrogenase